MNDNDDDQIRGISIASAGALFRKLRRQVDHLYTIFHRQESTPGQREEALKTSEIKESAADALRGYALDVAPTSEEDSLVQFDLAFPVWEALEGEISNNPELAALYGVEVKRIRRAILGAVGVMSGSAGISLEKFTVSDLGRMYVQEFPASARFDFACETMGDL